MTTLGELVDLRRLIIERPEDVSLRRVFADALLERGNPRGEFTRLQCDLAELGNDQLPLRTRLASAEGVLLRKHQVAWFPPLRRERFRQTVYFERGFVQRWSCHAHHFLEHGRWVVSHHPLRAVTMRNVDEASADALGAMTAFTSLPEVDLLLRCPPWLPVSRLRFTKLKSLALEGTTLTPGDGFDALCEAPWWKGLESLQLGFRLREDDLDAFECSGLLQNVKHLAVRAGAVRVPAPEVTQLKLTIWVPDRHPLGPVLANVPKLEALTLRSLSTHAVNDDALGGLPERLKVLRLEQLQLTEASVDALVGNAHLKRLVLYDCQLSAVSYDRLRLRWDDRFWRCTELGTRRRLP